MAAGIGNLQGILPGAQIEPSGSPSSYTSGCGITLDRGASSTGESASGGVQVFRAEASTDRAARADAERRLDSFCRKWPGLDDETIAARFDPPGLADKACGIIVKKKEQTDDFTGAEVAMLKGRDFFRISLRTTGDPDSNRSRAEAIAREVVRTAQG